MNIYPEQILIAVGVICAVLAVIFTIYLFVSKQKSKMYKRIIDDDTTEVLSLMQSTESFWNDEQKSIDLEKTELISEPLSYTEFISTMNDPTEVISDNVIDSRFKPIEEGALEGKYIIEKEITGGGMSKVYLARHSKLGNKWIIKYIDGGMSFLANEEHILKRLNHINLPKIVDIFHDKLGIYIVETYIEGVSLDKVLASGQTISPALALDFAEQFVMVLNYLHTLKPHPIIHCDLKPSNIIITPDNKLVLIDFGISKVSGSESNMPMAATYRYAAPEQLRKNVPEKYMGMVSLRFGDAAREFFQTNTDERTDIFSMGAILFEMITGQIPTVNNKAILKEYVSDDFAKVIYKCIQTDPDNRFSSAEEIKKELQGVRVSKVSMVKSLFARRAVFASTLLLTVLSATSFAGGAYLIQLENGATITVYPDAVTVSMKQSTQIVLEKLFEGGQTADLKAEDVVWRSEDGNVATITGDNLVGVNAGKTMIIGSYKDKKIKIKVNVTEKIDGQAEVSLRYNDSGIVEKFCGGSGVLETVDGDLESVHFAMPESMAQTDNGTIYLSDAGVIRKFDGKEFTTLTTDLDYYVKADKVRSNGKDIYILSDVYYDTNDEARYGIYKLNSDKLELIAEFDAVNTNINDIAVDDNYIYYAESIPFASSSSLTRLDLSNNESEVLTGIESEVKGITYGNNIIYMSVGDDFSDFSGIISYNIDSGEISNVAGIKSMKNFVDGEAIQCFSPGQLQFFNDQLYFMDYNVLRKIVTINDKINSVTVAGVPSAEFNETEITEPTPSSEVILTDLNRNFMVSEDGIYMTDMYNGSVLKITE